MNSGRNVAFVLIVSALVALIWLKPKKNSYPQVISGTGFDGATWENELRNPALTTKNLVELFASALAAQETNARVSITGPQQISVTSNKGNVQTYYLDNLLKSCAAQPDSKPEICKKYIEACLESGTASQTSAPSLAQSNIIPVIVDDEFMAHLPEGLSGVKKLAAERFVGDLWVAYVIDAPTTMSYLNVEEESKMGLNLSSLRELGTSNLQHILPEPKRQSVGPLFIITADGNYEASLLLVDSLWNQQAAVVKGDIIAAVPARQTLLFTDSASTQGVKLLQVEAGKLHDKEPYPISKTLLVRTNGHWETYSN